MTPPNLLTRLIGHWFPSPLDKQRKATLDAFDRAKAAYKDACDRGDTRDMKRHWPEFFRTQNERLRLGL